MSLRLFRHRALHLADVVPEDIAELLTAIIAARLAFLVTGSTGSGKTTLLNALLGEVPPTERIVIVEDSAELQPRHPHVVSLEARLSNVEGAGAVTLRELIRQALRMRPDRLVVGECRGVEVVDLLAALNTGHEGGAGTLHANAPTDVPARLEALGLVAGVNRSALHAQLASAVHVVLHVQRTEGRRQLAEVCVLRQRSDGIVTTETAWRRETGVGPAGRQLVSLLVARGVRVPTGLKAPKGTP